jgi:hypothetical protein
MMMYNPTLNLPNKRRFWRRHLPLTQILGYNILCIFGDLIQGMPILLLLQNECKLTDLALACAIKTHPTADSGDAHSWEPAPCTIRVSLKCLTT